MASQPSYFSAWQTGQEKKAATITVLVTESSFKASVVKVDGVEIKGEDGKRVFTTPALEAGKEYKFAVEAFLEPNNYTKINRPRVVTVKAGRRRETGPDG